MTTPRETLPTQTLVEQAVAGDSAAAEAICARFLPRLVSWATGRLPPHARDLLDTEDIVHEALVRSLAHLPGFSDQRGSFLVYVQTAIRNQIRDEIRRIRRRPKRHDLDETLPDQQPSQIDQCLSQEDQARYQEALSHLSPDEQELIVSKLELQMTPLELAIHTGRPSPDAARMAAQRAIRKLAAAMGGNGHVP
jgi:RNA polymerase sigma-70 factor, ECF subfamily